MSNPVVDVAKGQQKEDIHTLSTGVRVRLKPVPPALVLDVMHRVKPPSVPVVWIDQKGREEPNPNDPSYLLEVERYEQARGAAAFDAVAMFGLELVDDDWQQDTGWITKLKLLSIEFDVDDPVSCEFFYKKHVALGTEDLELVQDMMGVAQKDVDRAKKS